MALNDDLDKSKKRLDELKKQYENISGLTSPFKNFKGDLDEANAAIAQMQDLIDIAKTKASDIAVGFKRIVEEVRNTNKGLSGATSSFNKLSNLASKLQDHNTEIAELSLKDLATLKQKTLQEKNRLEESQELLKTRIDELKVEENRSKSQEKEFQASISAHNEIEAILKSEDGLYSGLLLKIQEATKETEEQEKNTKALHEATGLLGDSVDGLDEGLKKIGFGKLSERLNLKGALGEGVKKAKELGINSQNAATGFQKFQIGTKIASSAIGNLAKSLMKGGPLVAGLVIAVKLINFFKDAMFAASKTIAEFQRDLAISRDEASALRDRSNDIAGASSNILLTQKQIIASFKETNKLLGISFDFTSKMGAAGGKLLQDFTMLKDNFGLSTDALKGLTSESIRTGESMEDISTEILGQTALIGEQRGVTLDYNSVLTEVATTSGNIRSSFADGAKELAKAVIQSRYLGLTLAQNDKIAGSLLNFESSIQSEMEAELFLGKQLNFEKARSLALDNDIAGATKEVMKQLGTHNDFLKMNRFQREAIAKSAGLSVDELADSLRKQEELNKLGKVALLLGKQTADVEGKSLAGIIKQAKALGKTEEQIKDILGEQVFQRKLAEDASARFAKVMDRVQEVFANLVDGGILDKFAAQLTKFAVIADEEDIATALGLSFMGPSAETEAKAEAAANKLVLNEIRDELKKSNDKKGNVYIDGNTAGYTMSINNWNVQ